MQYRLGENAKVYYSGTAVTSTTYTLPTTTIDRVQDVVVGAKNDTPEHTTRDSGGQKQYGASLQDLGVKFKIKVPASGGTDAAYSALRDAFINKTEIAIFALDDLKAVIGAEGPAGNFVVASFDRDETGGKILFCDVELKPSSFNTWYIVAS